MHGIFVVLDGAAVVDGDAVVVLGSHVGRGFAPVKHTELNTTPWSAGVQSKHGCRQEQFVCEFGWMHELLSVQYPPTPSDRHIQEQLNPVHGANVVVVGAAVVDDGLYVVVVGIAVVVVGVPVVVDLHLVSHGVDVISHTSCPGATG